MSLQDWIDALGDDYFAFAELVDEHQDALEIAHRERGNCDECTNNAYCEYIGEFVDVCAREEVAQELGWIEHD